MDTTRETQKIKDMIEEDRKKVSSMQELNELK